LFLLKIALIEKLFKERVSMISCHGELSGLLRNIASMNSHLHKELLNFELFGLILAFIKVFDVLSVLDLAIT